MQETRNFVNLWLSTSMTEGRQSIDHFYLKLLGKSKINQFDEANPIQQQILGLQVSIDDPTTVQIVKGLNHTGRVKSGGTIIKVATVPKLPKCYWPFTPRTLCSCLTDLRMVQSSPPKQDSMSMYRYLRSLKVLKSLTMKWQSDSSMISFSDMMCCCWRVSTI